MNRRWSLLAVLVLAFALIGASNAQASDCGLDDGPDHSLCGCACHHVGALAVDARTQAPALGAPLPARGPTGLPHRSERPPLRPPIG